MRRPKKVLSKCLFYLLVAIILAYILIPVTWLFISTLVWETDLVRLSGELKLPEHGIRFDYYKVLLFPWLPTEVEWGIWTGWFLLDSLKDTTIVAISTTALTLILGSLAGYAVGRVKFPGRSAFFTFLIVIQMIPGLAILIPIFIMIRQAQLIDTYIGYILPLAAFFAPFVAWMMIGFFENIPIELEEQGLVDGCTRFQAFLRVTLPLAAPGLVSSAVWSFLSTWGELMFALVLTGANVNPLTVVIALGIGEVQARYGFMCAQAVIALAPPLIMAVVLQKYIVKGLTAGAIKG